MRTPVIALLFLTLAGYACKKDRSVANYQGDYEISGRVLDEITSNGIPYADVGILEEGRNQTSHLGTRSVVQGKTDAEGRFTLKFNADAEKMDYMLTAKASLYFDKVSGDYITFTKNGKRSQDVKLLPYSFLKVRIIGNKAGKQININGVGGPFFMGVDTVKISAEMPHSYIRHTYWVYFRIPQKIIKIPLK